MDKTPKIKDAIDKGKGKIVKKGNNETKEKIDKFTESVTLNNLYKHPEREKMLKAAFNHLLALTKKNQVDAKTARNPRERLQYIIDSESAVEASRKVSYLLKGLRNRDSSLGEVWDEIINTTGNIKKWQEMVIDTINEEIGNNRVIDGSHAPQEEQEGDQGTHESLDAVIKKSKEKLRELRRNFRSIEGTWVVSLLPEEQRKWETLEQSISDSYLKAVQSFDHAVVRGACNSYVQGVRELEKLWESIERVKDLDGINDEGEKEVYNRFKESYTKFDENKNKINRMLKNDNLRALEGINGDNLRALETIEKISYDYNLSIKEFSDLRGKKYPNFVKGENKKTLSEIVDSMETIVAQLEDIKGIYGRFIHHASEINNNSSEMPEDMRSIYSRIEDSYATVCEIINNGSMPLRAEELHNRYKTLIKELINPEDENRRTLREIVHSMETIEAQLKNIKGIYDRFIYASEINNNSSNPSKIPEDMKSNYRRIFNSYAMVCKIINNGSMPLGAEELHNRYKTLIKELINPKGENKKTLPEIAHSMETIEAQILELKEPALKELIPLRVNIDIIADEYNISGKEYTTDTEERLQNLIKEAHKIIMPVYRSGGRNKDKVLQEIPRIIGSLMEIYLSS